jgi:uncharacterized membrane protein
MRARRNLTRVDRLGYIVGGVALMLWALRRPSLRRSAGAGLGGWLLYQAYTGDNPMFRPLGIEVNTEPAPWGQTRAPARLVAETLVVEEAISISRPRSEVYEFFRAAGNLPASRGGTLELIREEPHETLAWRALRNGKLLHFGSLLLRDAPGARGTIAAARLEYVPSGGSLGTALAHIMGHSPQRLLAESLRRARQLLETGVVATTHGQPAGSR